MNSIFYIILFFFISLPIFGVDPVKSAPNERCLTTSKLKNSNAKIPAKSYPKKNTRGLAWYRADLGETFNLVLSQLIGDSSKSFTTIDGGSGFGIFSLDLVNNHANARSYSLNMQDFWRALEVGELGSPEFISYMISYFGLNYSDNDLKTVISFVNRHKDSGRFHYLTGRLSEVVLADKEFYGVADIITSFYGDFTYSDNKVKVLQAHLSSLKKEGFAFYQYDRRPRSYPEGLADQNVAVRYKDQEINVVLFDLLFTLFPDVFKVEWVDNPNNLSKHHILIMKKPGNQKRLNEVERFLSSIDFLESRTQLVSLGRTFSGKSKGSYELIHSSYVINAENKDQFSSLTNIKNIYPFPYPY